MAIDLLRDLETEINQILENDLTRFSVDIKLNFLESDEAIQNDIQRLFNNLQSTMKGERKNYADATMSAIVKKCEIFNEDLLKQEFILLIQSFYIKKKSIPVIDLFYKIVGKNIIIRHPREFAYIIGRSYMAFVYKVKFTRYFLLII